MLLFVLVEVNSTMRKVSFILAVACIQFAWRFASGDFNEPVSGQEAAYAVAARQIVRNELLPTCNKPAAKKILLCGCSAYFSKMVLVKQASRVNMHCRNFFGERIRSVEHMTGCQDYMNGAQINQEKLVRDANDILSNCLNSFAPIELVDFS